jgi:hypothetical protein
MGPSRKRNHTRRATKARSVKPSPKPRNKPTLSPAAMKKRLAKRKPVAGLGTAAVDALHEMRRAGDGPSLRYRQAVEAVGTKLRDVVARLKRTECYLIVAGIALEQGADYSGYIAVLLKRAVGNLLFKQIRALEDLAARCDCGPPSDRDHEDDPMYDEDTGGAQ